MGSNLQNLLAKTRFAMLVLIALITMQWCDALPVHAQRPSLAGLQNQIDELIENGQFEQLRVASSQQSQASTLFFGPTDLCTIEVDQNGPSGITINDPIGLRLMDPSLAETPRLLFGPNDNCQIRLGPLGQTLEDPLGVQIQNPDPKQPSSLRFGHTGDCSIRAGVASGPGMIFEDPSGFLFSGQSQVLADFEGTVQAEAFVQSSSRRWKEDIKPIDEPLDRIGRLQGVSFNWKKSHGGRPDIGFIAEDVAKVLPELVQLESDQDSVSGLKYGNLVALAVEGIKAQQHQIQHLKKRNSQLENEIEMLRDQFEALNARIATVEQR